MKVYEAPIFFEKNRVFRVYTGGKMFDHFVGDGSVDDFFPEEWVASSTKALNEGRNVYKEGISKIKDNDLYLDEAIKKFPKEMLGEKNSIGVLVKYLDSAIRLPAQAHPNKEFSRKYFNSNYGKEECWIILAKRPNASIYFGFKDGVDKKILRQTIEESKTNKEAFEKILLKHEVEVGDVVFIPALTPHAIGAGCLLLEVQEPTDFTIQPERWCGDYKLSDYQMYLGLDKDVALQCFSYEPIKKVKNTPRFTVNTNSLKVERLLSPDQENSFKINRITLNDGEYVLNQPVAVCSIIEGEGEILGDNFTKKVKQGDYFFFPACCCGKFIINGNLKMIEAFS